jgi:hypothetical protein
MYRITFELTITDAIFDAPTNFEMPPWTTELGIYSFPPIWLV